MNAAPIFDAACWDRGALLVARPLGTLDPPRIEFIGQWCDACGNTPVDVDEPERGMCRGCLDDVSACRENERKEALTWHLAEDEWGDLPTVGGAA